MRQVLIASLLFYAILGFASQAGRIDSISPAAARVGETVTINGHGFGALNVRVTVGGVPALILLANGNQVTFQVPNSVKPGFTQVVATNPGFQSGSIDFLMLDGILLPGSASASAISALFEIAPKGATESEIQDHVILTRLDLRLADGATVGGLNTALQQVNGGIVSMAPGKPGVTIAVPLQPSVSALEELSSRLQQMPGIAFSTIGREIGPMSLPFTPKADNPRLQESAHLLPERFPAAWNASALKKGCTPLPVLIADYFGPTPAGFGVEIPTFVPPAPPPAPLDEFEGQHGYLDARLVAADFTNGSVPGTDPFPSCLSVQLVQIAGQTPREQAQTISDNFPPSGKFIVNFSLGYNDDCFRAATATEPADFTCHPPLDATLEPPLGRAKDAITWKEFTAGRWGDFLIATSAGNSHDAPSTPIYPGMGDSRFTNMIAISGLNDPLFNFMNDARLWSPTAGFPQFDTLVPAASDASSLQGYVTQHGLGQTVADNSIVVGGTTAPQGDLLANPIAPEALVVAKDSEVNPQVLAVSENIFNEGHDGTSGAAPQVAGLASYLWLLSPALRQMSPSVTVQDIVANAWDNAGSANGLIDAYATVLSLDAPGPLTATNAPVRLAILDANGDGVFDENDLMPFLKQYFNVDANGNLTTVLASPTTVNYGPFDLNGDGFTGGDSVERFDLDRINSIQFGKSDYSDHVTEEIEGEQMTFNENALTDLQIFCYYAYSQLYQGDIGQRTNMLGGYCFHIQVQVNPGRATLAIGATQQFSATVHGSSDPRVNWSVDGIDGGNSSVGTIDASGLYTAPSSPGTHTVRATSHADPNSFGEATVTVTAGTTAGVFLGTGLHNGNGPLVFEANIVFVNSNGIQTSSTSFEWPINDVGGFLAKVNTIVAGVTNFSVYSMAFGNTPAPVSVSISLSAPVGNLTVAGSSCGSSYNVSAGDVDNLNLLPQCNSTVNVNVHDVNSTAELDPDHSTVTLTAHNIGLGQGKVGALFIGCAFTFGCFTVQSSTVNVQAQAMGQLSVTAANSSVKVSGQIQPWNVPFQCGNNGSDAGCFPGVYLQGNNNTDLTAQLSGNVAFFFLDNNTWSATPPISIGDEVIARDITTVNLGLVSITNNRGLSLGSINGLDQITGHLRITGNIGFSDDAANTFANGRSVQGGIEISGNQ